MSQENFKAMRKAMIVSQLRTTDVSDPRIIAAISHIAREDFVPSKMRKIAYSDRGVNIGEGRTLNAPLTTGLLLNAANITKKDNVLLIGAATGYTAAVISELAGSVVAIEQSAKLAGKAKANLETYGNVKIEKHDLATGFPRGTPYSVIVIDGIVEEIPEVIIKQLDSKGRLVASIIEGGVARLALGYKTAGAMSYQYFSDCGGTALPGFEKSKSFSF